MNWLAHVALSEPDPEIRLGNVLADLIKGEKRLGLPPAIRRGTDCHLFVDAFTDAHPVFLRSRARISPPRRRFASILVDLFFDHCLSLAWDHFHEQPRMVFIREVYGQFDALSRERLPEARPFVEHMLAQDWLGDYISVAGIERTLARVSRRLHRPGLLVPMIDELTTNLTGLREDFAAFYPALRAAVAGWVDGQK